MEKRETSKVFDFGDRKWRIGKFDAFTGSYIAYKLMAEVLPMGLAQQVDIPLPPGDAKPMSKADFFDLQRDCLGVCAELLDSGPTPVLNEQGNFGVIGLEHDAPTVLALTVQVLVFNVASFFDERLLTLLSGAMSNLKLPTAPTSTSMSTPQ